jgi:hypothetical protein
MKPEKRAGVIRPYQLQELAALYGVSYKTFHAWFSQFKSEVGKIHGKCLTIPQVRIVFEKLDYPPGFFEDEMPTGSKS